MDLPTYTNIWRIEKRLYKLYDFRLPMPLPISWIAVFCGITIPYVVVLAAIGLPFNHNLVWLYILPPGVLTWLTTRPVLENKRLPELLVSQLRYIGEPRTWCRLAPLSEKDEIRVYARMWHRAPGAPAQAAELAMTAAQAARDAGTGAPPLPVRTRPADTPAPQRNAQPARGTWPGRQEQPDPASRRAPAGPAARPAGGQVRDGGRSAAARAVPGPGGIGRAIPDWARADRPDPARTGPAPSRAVSGGASAARRPAIPGRVLRDSAAEAPAALDRGPLPITPPPIEVSHEIQGPPGPAAVPLWGRRPGRAVPGHLGPGVARGAPPPRALPPAAPEPPAPAPAPAPGMMDVRAAGAPAVPVPQLPEAVALAAPAAPAGPARPAPGARRPAARTSEVPEQARRPMPSIERALNGPAAGRIDGWQRRVRVVPGGQGPGKRDQETLNRDRARLPLAGPRRIVFLGCSSGAGQTVTALMTGQLLAELRGAPVAAVDLNPGRGSLIRQARAAPALTVAALLAGSAPPGEAAPGGDGTAARFDVISCDAGPPGPAPGERDYPRLADRTARYYPLTMLDPGAAEATRVLRIADQLVLIAPASGDAPRSLAMTQQWLGANGHGELAARAVTVVNGVSRASRGDAEQAEAAARGRCRAIVRIPWDDVLAGGARGVPALGPQARHAYTALAGVLVAGLAAVPVPRKVAR